MSRIFWGNERLIVDKFGPGVGRVYDNEYKPGSSLIFAWGSFAVGQVLRYDSIAAGVVVKVRDLVDGVPLVSAESSTQGKNRRITKAEGWLLGSRDKCSGELFPGGIYSGHNLVVENIRNIPGSETMVPPIGVVLDDGSRNDRVIHFPGPISSVFIHIAA